MQSLVFYTRISGQIELVQRYAGFWSFCRQEALGHRSDDLASHGEVAIGLTHTDKTPPAIPVGRRHQRTVPHRPVAYHAASD